MNVKLNTLFLLLSCLCASLGLSAQTEIIDKVIATVGGEYILLSELEEQYALAYSQQEGNLPAEARCFIFEGILGQKLLVNQAKIDSVEVSEVEVEVQLNTRIEQILAYMNNDISQFEAYYGQTVNEVKEEFREDLKSQLLAERMRGTVLGDVKVTPNEVKSFFAKIPKDSLPYFNAEVEVRELVMLPQVNAEERQKAIEKITDLRERSLAGEDFAALASKYSDDFGSARIGGDLGWAKRGKFVPEFEAAAYNLEPMEFSEIVESDFGFHLIQLIERRGNSIHARHILIKPAITTADEERAEAKLDSVRQLIVNDSMSFSYAVKRFSSEDVQSTNNDGRMTNPNSGNTFFQIADLDPDIFFTIDTMKINTISKPYAFKTPRGETQFRILLLESRSQPHKASLETDYSKIQSAAIESKKERFFAKWVADKAKNTYIYIDPAYEGCVNISNWVTN